MKNIEVVVRLGELKHGAKGRIKSIGIGEKVYRHRLISMGLIPGTEFVLSHTAPFGDPIEILVRGFSLILRKNEANILEIEEVLA